MDNETATMQRQQGQRDRKKKNVVIVLGMIFGFVGIPLLGGLLYVLITIWEWMVERWPRIKKDVGLRVLCGIFCFVAALLTPMWLVLSLVGAVLFGVFVSVSKVFKGSESCCGIPLRRGKGAADQGASDGNGQGDGNNNGGGTEVDGAGDADRDLEAAAAAALGAVESTRGGVQVEEAGIELPSYGEACKVRP